jgi:hypothetical protein
MKPLPLSISGAAFAFSLTNQHTQQLMKESQARVTPIGVAEWARLDAPDTRYSKPGTYSIGVRLTTEDAARLKIEIDKRALLAWEQAQAKAAEGTTLELADPPYRENTEDGTVLFPFRMKARKPGKKGGRQTPIVVTADSKPMRRDRVTRGAKVRVSYTLTPYNSGLKGVGVSLQLVGVQHIANVDASYFGFVPVDAWAAQPQTTGK